MLYKIEQYQMTGSEPIFRWPRSPGMRKLYLQGAAPCAKNNRKARSGHDDKAARGVDETTGGSVDHAHSCRRSTRLASRRARQAPATRLRHGCRDASAAKPHDDSFVIGNDDVLAINVWKEPDISRSIPVRSDGKISLPLVGEVQAAGLTPLKLEKEIAEKLQELHFRAGSYGDGAADQQPEIQRSGTSACIRDRIVIANSPTVLDAIALAGGFRDFAKQKSIYVLRQNAGGDPARLAVQLQRSEQGQESGTEREASAAATRSLSRNESSFVIMKIAQHSLRSECCCCWPECRAWAQDDHQRAGAANSAQTCTP